MGGDFGATQFVTDEKLRLTLELTLARTQQNGVTHLAFWGIRHEDGPRGFIAVPGNTLSHHQSGKKLLCS